MTPSAKLQRPTAQSGLLLAGRTKEGRYSEGKAMADERRADRKSTPEGPPDQEATDRSLLKRLQNGQTDAATALYVRYAERLRALATVQLGNDLAARLDPEDLVQSVFRSFFRRAVDDHYDVPEGEELWKLFLVIGLHKIRDAASFHHAAKRDVRATETGVAFDLATQRVTGADEATLADLRLLIEEILANLPASQRSIVELRIEGYQVNEIAEKTERSRRSVERALQDFRQRLSALLDEDV